MCTILFLNAIKGIMERSFLVFAETKISDMANRKCNHILASSAGHVAASFPLISVHVKTQQLAKHFSARMFSGKIPPAEEVDIVACGA